MEVGLALSGGGVRGAAHIGAIKALLENEITINAIGGTSAGAMVAALYALEYSPDDMLKLFKYFSKAVLGTSPKYMIASFKSADGGLRNGGITSSLNIELAIKEAAKLKNIENIEEIKIPLIIPATDMISGKEILFTNQQNIEGEQYVTKIELGKAVRASSTYPGMYSPFNYKEYQFIDGGIFDNLPVREVKKIGAKKVIGIKFATGEAPKQTNILNVAMRTLDLMFDKLMQDSIQQSDYTISIQAQNINLFNTGKIEECYELGYQQTLENMESIKQTLQERKEE